MLSPKTDFKTDYSVYKIHFISLTNRVFSGSFEPEASGGEGCCVGEGVVCAAEGEGVVARFAHGEELARHLPPQHDRRAHSRHLRHARPRLQMRPQRTPVRQAILNESIRRANDKIC